jgi:hypothetical protein
MHLSCSSTLHWAARDRTPAAATAGLINQINALDLIRLFPVVSLTRQYDHFADNMRDVKNTNASSVALDRWIGAQTVWSCAGVPHSSSAKCWIGLIS